MKKDWIIEKAKGFQFNVGDIIDFGLIWDNEYCGFGSELLESGTIPVSYEENGNFKDTTFCFEVITENKEEPWKTKVKITSIA